MADEHTEPDFLNRVAKEHFGINYIFPYQRLAIANILEGKSQIVILPTGAGKSLCFMLPALLTEGITLIIFPLLSLMADQKRRLDSAGISSVLLRGGMSEEEKENTYTSIRNGAVKIIIANPEILQAPGVLEKVRKGNIFHVVIDEAHTVSQWGDTFREAYLGLGKIIEELSPKVTTAFTATASAQILERFREIIFGEGEPNIIRADPDRPNIRYDVLRYISKSATLLDAVKNAEKPLIVFCSSREGTEITARKLKSELPGNDVWFYHAGLTKEEKKNIEELFFRSEDGVLVATCAYGMGVDKSNIRTVIHSDLPSSAEAYLQESGRGGRDRKQAYAIAMIPYHIEKPNRLESIFMGSQCRRKELLRILENENELCSGCDICDKKSTPVKGLEEILTLIKNNPRGLTTKQVAAILKGRPSPENISARYFQSEGWGKLRNWSEKEILAAVQMLIQSGNITRKKKLVQKCKKNLHS